MTPYGFDTPEPTTPRNLHLTRNRNGLTAEVPRIMGAFFKPWRRKAGCVTLLTACVFAAGWVRSLTICDGMAITFTKSRYSVRSYRHQILWDHEHVKNGRLYHPFFSHFRVIISEATHSDPFDGFRECHWRVSAGDFYIASGIGLAGYYSNFVPKPGPPVRFSLMIAQTPYWSIVLPLTLLSAWLLLGTPRSHALQLNGPATAAGE